MSLVINVLDFGADNTGIADSTSAIENALTQAQTNGGGTIFFPSGIYLTNTQTLQNNIVLLGSGASNTTIKLNDNTNDNLFSAYTSSINLSAAYGSGSDIGINSFSIANLTLDGNKANQSSGPSYPLTFYGYNFILFNVDFINGYSGGILTDWHPSDAQDNAEGRLTNVRVYHCNGYGVETGGPSDSQWDKCGFYLNELGEVHIAPNAAGIQVSNTHSWNMGTGSTIGWLIESNGCLFGNTEAEAEGTANVVLLGDTLTWYGGRVYAGSLGSSAPGFQIGQLSGQTPYPHQILVSDGTTIAVAPKGYTLDLCISDITSSHGGVCFVNDGGLAKIAITSILQPGGKIYTGTPANTSFQQWVVGGLTADGTTPTSGGVNISASSYNALSVSNAAGKLIYNVDTFDDPGNITMFNGASFQMNDISENNTLTLSNGYISFGSSYDTNLHRADVAILQTDGVFAVGQTTISLSNNGTIPTSSYGSVCVNPSTNITGIILQAGTVAGQFITVINQSSFSVTFAAASTSHVASGTSTSIAANTSRTFCWNTNTSRWY
jgi:hypothetical protein